MEIYEITLKVQSDKPPVVDVEHGYHGFHCDLTIKGEDLSVTIERIEKVAETVCIDDLPGEAVK